MTRPTNYLALVARNESRLAEAAVAKLSDAWCCTIAGVMAAELEHICDETVKIRRLESRSRKLKVNLSRADAARKRKQIVGTATRLRNLLVLDPAHPGLWEKLASLDDDSCQRAKEEMGRLFRALDWLIAFAEDPAPAKKGAGRTETNDAWDYFIESTALVYLRAIGKRPKADWQAKHGRPDGPYLRGLYILHEMLPGDLRQTSSALGNRANTVLGRKRYQRLEKLAIEMRIRLVVARHLASRYAGRNSRKAAN